MIKKLVVVAALLAAGSANAALNTGDIAFTAFNADEDGWTLTTFVDIEANTKVYFTDNEYVSGAFNTGESFSSWTTGSSIVAAGSVIRFNNVDNATTLGASVGSFLRETVTGSTNYGLSQSGDTVYAYLGTTASAPTTFLAAISSAGFTAAEGSLVGTGLTVGVNATQLVLGSDFAEYTGARAGQTTFAAYQPLVANTAANWTDLGDGTFTAQVPNTTAFTVTVAPVPEPETYALLLAGLGLVGFAARRRQAV